MRPHLAGRWRGAAAQLVVGTGFALVPTSLGAQMLEPPYACRVADRPRLGVMVRGVARQQV
jgi:hypothetical protein